MKISAAALDARFACHNAPNQYVHEMIPNDAKVKDYIDYLNVHNYPFIKTPCGVEVDDLKLEYTPESPNGGFMALKNMDEWRRRNGIEHARINITEFEWNSDKEECNFGVGEINQAAYIMRANLLAARFGIHKVFNYPLSRLTYSTRWFLIFCLKCRFSGWTKRFGGSKLLFCLKQNSNLLPPKSHFSHVA